MGVSDVIYFQMMYVQYIYIANLMIHIKIEIKKNSKPTSYTKSKYN